MVNGQGQGRYAITVGVSKIISKLETVLLLLILYNNRVVAQQQNRMRSLSCFLRHNCGDCLFLLVSPLPRAFRANRQGNLFG